MRCLSCQYDLRNLAEHRCPECGRAFDPADPHSFETPKLRGQRRWVTCAIWLNICYGLFILGYATLHGPLILLPILILPLIAILFGYFKSKRLRSWQSS